MVPQPAARIGPVNTSRLAHPMGHIRGSSSVTNAKEEVTDADKDG